MPRLIVVIIFALFILCGCKSADENKILPDSTTVSQAKISASYSINHMTGFHPIVTQGGYLHAGSRP